MIFYKDQRGYGEHTVMLCTYKKLRELLRQFKGFERPDQYGKVIYSGHDITPNQLLKAMMKSRYSFDLDQFEMAGSEKP